MAEALAQICGPCRQERAKWLDSTPSQILPAFGIVHGSGAPYDASSAGLRDRSRSRHEQWRSLVTFQMKLIARTCRANRHTAPAGEPTLMIVQLDLLIELHDVRFLADTEAHANQEGGEPRG